MLVHPATSSRVVLLECGARPTDLGYYAHACDWPTASASEGQGDLWACVAADGRLRIFQGALASSRTLLHSTPVLGPVLSLALWAARKVAITLEESTDSRRDRYSRIVRFYSWAEPKEREVLELAAVELDQAPGSPIFSPSLFSLCTTTRTLALADDHKIKLYHLDDIFADPLQHVPHEDLAAAEAEPGADTSLRSPKSPFPPLSPTSRAGALAATFPHTRRYVVKVYQVLPIVTLFSPFSVRHLDYKQSFLSYGSYNECRLVCVRLEQAQGGRAGAIERQAIEQERVRAEAALPRSQSLVPPRPPPTPIAAPTPPATPASAALSKGKRSSSSAKLLSHPSSRAPSGTHTAPPPPPPPPEPFELIGVRSFDSELRMILRDDMFVRECVLVLHRFNATQQIHTIRLLPPLKQRTGAHLSRSAVATNPSLVTPQPRRTLSGVNPQQRPSQPSSPAPLATVSSISTHPMSTKHELFNLLGQGLPTHPFSVPLAASTSSPSFVTSASSSSLSISAGVVVELLDDEAEASSTREQLAGLLARLEELEDESEEMAANAATKREPTATTTTAKQIDLAKNGEGEGAGEAPAPTMPDTAGAPPRSNGRIYLPMRLLVSGSDECYLYDVESDRRLATYFFEHDLVSLQVRSSFVLALTTHGLEVHSLWYAHPMLHYLMMPFVFREDFKDKIQDMLVLDHHILLRPAPTANRTSGGSTSGGMGASPPVQLIVPTEDMDPCESWAAWPIKPMPSVLEVVATSIQPFAIKSMQSSKEATPSAIRLFTEALLLLIQRYSQLCSVLVERTAASSTAVERTSASSLSSGGGGSNLSFVDGVRLEREFTGVAASLSSINSYLAHLFLSSQELGLSCYFFYYQHDAPLAQLWAQLTGDVAAPSSSSASASSHTRYVTKLLFKVLLRPTSGEQTLLLGSPELIASFIARLGVHAPHVLGSVLLKTFLLHCPYDPKQILAILEANTARANYEAATAGPGGQSSSSPYKPSRGTSATNTPTSATAPGAMSQTPYRVRPVVFHTFVQALMHLQLGSAAAAAAGGSGSSGTDAASILLHSFSGQSLEYLLVTYSSLLTTWSHRHLLIDLLRTSVPWSLLEALVVLTQRGELHVHDGITLLLGSQAAASVLAPTSPSGAAGAPISPSSAFASSISLTQLQAYLECSLNPYLLAQETGRQLEHSTSHAINIEPFDSTQDKEAYMATAASAVAPVAKLDEAAHEAAHEPHGKFVPFHVRELGHGEQPTAIITRAQVAALATQLACFYIQHELLEGLASSSRSSSHFAPSSPMTSPAPPRRTTSHSMSMSLAPAAEFASKHPLGTWWRAAWLDELRGQVGPDSTPEALRIRRLQALLSMPLPLQRRHFVQIGALVSQMGPDQPGGPPTKASLLMLVLPRVGELSSALRLLVGHSPECMWPYAQIYCGEPTLDQHATQRAIVMRHWQLLHGVLLLHVFHSAHSGAILQQHAPAHVARSVDVAADDANAARTLLQPLLPAHLVDQVLAPQAGEPSSATFPSPSGMSAVDRAALYQQLYVFLFNQLVTRHTPQDLLAFVPQAGSSSFYLPHIEASFAAAAELQRKQQQGQPRTAQRQY